MKKEGLVSSLTLLIAAFAMISSWVATSIAVRTYERGPVPEKRLVATGYSTGDALSTLRGASKTISVSVTANHKNLDNLFIYSASLKNTGQAPILPTDIYGKIAIKVAAPWKIIAVANNNKPALGFDWRRVSDTEFQAEPALINPGDQISINVFMNYSAPVLSDDDLTPSLEWSSRISNLSKIESPERRIYNVSGPLTVFLDLKAIIILVVSFVISTALYINLLYPLGFLTPWGVKSSVLIIGGAALSLFAAEAGTTYIIGPTLFVPQINHVINAPPLLLNAICLLALYVLWLRRPVKQRNSCYN